MATAEEEEFKILSQIRAMEEGDMKERLTAAFMDQLRLSSSSKNTAKSHYLLMPRLSEIPNPSRNINRMTRFTHSPWGR